MEKRTDSKAVEEAAEAVFAEDNRMEEEEETTAIRQEAAVDHLRAVIVAALRNGLLLTVNSNSLVSNSSIRHQLLPRQRTPNAHSNKIA
jgi:hypothetical protein